MTEEEKTIEPTMEEENNENAVMSEEYSNEIEKIKAELGDQKDKYLRLVAEFDNFKKRNTKERFDLIRNASQEMIQELLTIVDDFERAQKISIEQNNENIFPEGMNLVYQKLISLLKSKALKLWIQITKILIQCSMKQLPNFLVLAKN